MADLYGIAIQLDDKVTKGLSDISSRLDSLANKKLPKIKPEIDTSGFKDVFSGTMLGNFASNAFTGILSKAKELAMTIYEVGVQTEMAKTSFNVLTGSVAKGNEMFTKLKEFADVTPFDNTTTYEAAKMLMNYGIEAQNVIPYMKMLGDASGGVSDRFQRMTYAFGQISAAGRLQGQDLKQLIEAGFNPLQEMARTSGKSMEYFKDQMHAGKIGINDVVKAFQSATSEGGRFNGMMELQSKTVGGLASTMAGNFQNIAASIFDRVSPALKLLFEDTIKSEKSLTKLFEISGSDKLVERKAEFEALIGVLQQGNVPLEERKSIYEKLNTEYKDYLKFQINDGINLSGLNELQRYGNEELEKSITLLARKETAEKMLQDVKSSYIEAEKYDILASKAKRGTLSVTEKMSLLGTNEKLNLTTPLGLVNLAGEMYKGIDWEEKAKYWANAARSGAIGTQAELNLYKRGTVMSTGEMDIDKLRKVKKELNEFKEKNTHDNTSKKFESGIFGEAKNITVNIQKVQEINAGSIDGKDLKKAGRDVVDVMIDMLNTMSYGSAAQ